LSQQRAAAVANYLHQLAPVQFPTAGNNRRFSVDGHGSQNPVAENTSASGKAQNRRVEITLVN
jgi:outer membrane protein OmpA-like peptidoglycan-associated protein